jgi:hypothetical protein
VATGRWIDRIKSWYVKGLPYLIARFFNMGNLVLNFLGLGFRPMPPESNVESTLIWYKASDKDNIKYWTDEIDTFLKSKNKHKFFIFWKI